MRFESPSSSKQNGTKNSKALLDRIIAEGLRKPRHMATISTEASPNNDKDVSMGVLLQYDLLLFLPSHHAYARSHPFYDEGGGGPRARPPSLVQRGDYPNICMINQSCDAYFNVVYHALHELDIFYI